MERTRIKDKLSQTMFNSSSGQDRKETQLGIPLRSIELLTFLGKPTITITSTTLCMSDYLLFPALPYLEIDQKAIANITFFLTYSMFPVTTSAGWGYIRPSFLGSLNPQCSMNF